MRGTKLQWTLIVLSIIAGGEVVRSRKNHLIPVPSLKQKGGGECSPSPSP